MHIWHSGNGGAPAGGRAVRMAVLAAILAGTGLVMAGAAPATAGQAPLVIREYTCHGLPGWRPVPARLTVRLSAAAAIDRPIQPTRLSLAVTLPGADTEHLAGMGTAPSGRARPAHQPRPARQVGPARQARPARHARAARRARPARQVSPARQVGPVGLAARVRVRAAQDGAVTVESWLLPQVTAAIPAHGSLAVRLTGATPPVTEAAAGNVTFTAASLAVQLTTDGADMPGARSAALADLACTLSPGQPATLAMVPVAAATAGPRLPGQASAAPSKPSATLWGSNPGGNFTAALAGRAALTDTATGASVVCKSSGVAGTFKYGRNLPAAGIGSVTSFTLGTCHDQAGANLTVTTSASPSDRWPLNAQTYQILAAAATVGMTGITASIHGPGCSATVAGATSTEPGTVRDSLSSGSLGVSPAGGTLRLWDVRGCSGLFADGNPLAVSASYSVSVPEVISPDYCPPPFSLTTGFPFPANYQPPPWPKKSLVIRSPPQPPSQGCAYIYGFSDVNKAHEAALTGPGLGNLQIGKLTVANPNYCLPHRPRQCSYLQVDESGRLYYKPCPGIAPRCRPVNGMPPVRATLLGFGFVPTTATVHITQLGNLDVSTVGVGSVVVEARVESVILMRISHVLVNGAPLNVGGDCHTPPFRLTLNGMKGYNITEGGGLAGTIDIPKFTGCGVQENLDPIFNAAISGPGNYVQLTQGAVCGDWPPGAATGCPPGVPKPLR